MLEHPLLVSDMTAEHHELRRRALAYFTEERVGTWARDPRGFISRAQWQEFAEQGFLGVSLARECGGRGLGILGATIVSEACSQLADAGMASAMRVHNEIASQWMASTKQEEIRRRYLPEMASGRMIGCVCRTEPNHAFESHAERDGDELVVFAKKALIVNAFNADLYFVPLLFEGEISTVLVPRSAEGVEITHIYDRFGARLVDQVKIEFRGVRVPMSNILTSKSLKQMMVWNRVISRSRFTLALDAYFILRRLIKEASSFARRRRIGNKPHDVPLSEFSINQHAIARAASDLAVVRAGLAAGYVAFRDGHNPVEEMAALRFYAVQKATEFAQFCCELEGGAGYTNDSVFLRAYAQVAGLRMSGGSQTTMVEISNSFQASRITGHAVRAVVGDPS